MIGGHVIVLTDVSAEFPGLFKMCIVCSSLKVHF